MHLKVPLFTSKAQTDRDLSASGDFGPGGNL